MSLLGKKLAQASKEMKNWILVFVSIVIFSFTAAGCVGQEDIHAVRMQLSSEPMSLDSALVEDGNGIRIMGALMSGLLEYDQNYEPRPALAERYEVLDAGLRYRFYLRNIKWSDTIPLRAEDFVYGMLRALNPGTISKLADMLFFIKGARAYKQNRATVSSVGIRAISERILEIELEKPVAFFPHVLTVPVALPQREDIVKKYGAKWVAHMPSTGPYKLESWVHEQRISLESNPFYWGTRAAAAPQRVIFQIATDESTAVNLFEKGKLDVVFKAPSLDVKRLREKGVVKVFPFFATYYIGFDVRHPLWRNRDARLAFAQAIDREAIVSAMGDIDHSATSWVPEGIPGASLKQGVQRNLESAKKLWRNLKPAVPRTIIGFDSSQRNQLILERVQRDVAEIGLELALRPMSWKPYIQSLSGYNPGLFRFGWLSTIVDPHPSLAMFAGRGPNNYTKWNDPVFDKIVEEIGVAKPGSALRNRLIEKAQSILLERDVVVVPLFHYNQTVAVSDRLKGFSLNGVGLVNFSTLEIKASEK